MTKALKPCCPWRRSARHPVLVLSRMECGKEKKSKKDKKEKKEKKQKKEMARDLEETDSDKEPVALVVSFFVRMVLVGAFPSRSSNRKLSPWPLGEEHKTRKEKKEKKGKKEKKTKEPWKLHCRHEDRKRKLLTDMEVFPRPFDWLAS